MFALRQCYAGVLTEAADYYGARDVTRVRQWPPVVPASPGLTSCVTRQDFCARERERDSAGLDRQGGGSNVSLWSNYFISISRIHCYTATVLQLPLWEEQ